MQARARWLAVLGLAVALGASGQLCGLLCGVAAGTATPAAIEVAGEPDAHAGCAGPPPPRVPEEPAGCADHDCSDCDVLTMGRADPSELGIAAIATPGPLHATLPGAPQLRVLQAIPPEPVPRPRQILRTTSSLLL